MVWFCMVWRNANGFRRRVLLQSSQDSQGAGGLSGRNLRILVKFLDAERKGPGIGTLYLFFVLWVAII